MYHVNSMTRYLVSQGVGMAASLHCPGMYCGRMRNVESGNFSDCGVGVLEEQGVKAAVIVTVSCGVRALSFGNVCSQHRRVSTSS